MDKEKFLNYFLNSFLNPLLNNENITDISYSGGNIFYVDNLFGRKRSDISINQNTANDFIRQLANLSDQQFSYSQPFLDISIGRYRINAVHKSIGRMNNEETITFAIRIASKEIKIKDDSNFFSKEIVALIKVLLRSHASILIGGITSTGKTEFQRYLISSMEDLEHILIIDNVGELDNLNQKNQDITFYLHDNKNQNASFSKLIKNALRNNPSWLFLAEARGEEMLDSLNSAMTGLPLITTIHSLNASSIPSRIASLVLLNDIDMSFQNILREVYFHFHFYFYLSKIILDNGNIFRFVSQIIETDENGKINVICDYKNGKYEYFHLTEYNLSLLKFNDNDFLFKRTFVRNE